VEVADWVTGLRVIWSATGVSMNQFASLHPIDKGTLSRYLNGRRVPRDRWFLDKLLAIQADSGQPVTQDVREHLVELQLRALEVAHPHEYRVRRISDELELAVTGKLEAERHARALEGQLAERNRQALRLAEDKGRLQAAWDAERVDMQADHERLAREIDETTGQLNLARERTIQAELRCQILEGLLEYLDVETPDEEDSPGTFSLVRGRLKVVQGVDMRLPGPEGLNSLPADQAAAVEGLFRAAGPALFSRALLLSQGDRAQADDLVLRAFQDAVKHWSAGRDPVGSLDDGGKERWLYEALYRQAADDFRARPREVPAPDVDLAGSSAPRDTDLDRALIVMRRMPRARHMAACLWLLSGWPAAQVAVMLGMELSAVKEQLIKAREELSGELGPTQPIEDVPGDHGIPGKGAAAS
jgi:DNA-directed RNA polymerase specialized sigma24 family protein